MQRMRRWAVAVTAAAALACGEGTLGRRNGSFSASPSELFFGPVALGRDRVLELTLTNTSRVSYQLREIAPSVPNVSVEGFQAAAMAAGESRVFRVRFTPAVEGEVTGALAIATDDGAGQSLPLEGLGVRALAEVKTAAIDFGQVDVGSAKVENARLVNPTLVETSVRFSIEGEDAAQFSSSEVGAELILAAGEERQIPVAFRPVWMGLADARMAIARCAGCEPYAVSLSGEGVLGNLNVFPTRINFGRVALGAFASQPITLSNDGNRNIVIQRIALRDDASGSFALSATPALPLTAASFVPITFDVTFTPTALGSTRAALEIVVLTDGAERSVKLPVIGEGGASCVKILPAEIDFMTVPEGMSATRTAEVLNLCGYDVSILEATPLSTVNGYFSLGDPPRTSLVPSGQQVPIDVTYTPKPGTTVAEGRLSVRIAELAAITTVEVKLRGASKSFAPCAWELRPVSLDYGAVPVGAEAALGVALRNVGTDQCFVGTMQLAAGTDLAFTATPMNSALLDPGQQVVLKVSFRPGSAGAFAGLVEAWVNHPTNNHPSAALLGTGVQGCFALQPTHVDFGVTKLSCGPRVRPVVGFNTCSAPVTITQASLDSPASTEFTLASQPNLPLLLQPGEQAPFAVAYEPVDDGDDTAALRVTAEGLSYTAGMVALGLARPTRTDTFVQDARSKTDVLFVVDNSGSMMEEQEGLGQNFASFLSTAQTQLVDYHIAVTTTGIDPSPGGWSMCPGGADGGEAGRLFPVNGSTPRVITPTTPNAAQVFAFNVNVGWCHWNEQGLEAAYRALSAPLVNSSDDPRTALPNDGNAGFMRPDAKLAIVFLSDEEDYSTPPVSFYETFFKALKGDDPSMLSISAIVAPVALSTCPSASSAGTRYIQLAQSTGGVVESICTPDWASSLQNLSSSAFGPRRRFALSELPSDPAQISVQVNGIPVTGTWTYEDASRTVVFDEASAPPPGSIIQITYPLGC
jgi:hypothetical protein